MAPNGAYVVVGASSSWARTRLVTTPMLSPFVSQRLAVAMTRSDPADLATLRDLMETGQMTPVIDRRFGLRDTADASGMSSRATREGRL
jgi:NADPH:quinone reductase-like Zn-dependent oxidoreductase